MARASSECDWASLDRFGMASFFWFLAPKIVNQPLTVDQFHNMISRHLKKQMPLRITRNVDPTATSNMILIGGCYYSGRDQDDKTCIEVSLFYNPVDTRLKINSTRFWKICLGLADTILHEVIHMRQFRRRDFKYLPDYPSTANKESQREEQSYLGCSDEIDAYGFNIACELLDQFNNNTAHVIQYLNIDQQRNRKKSNTWRMYLNAFNHNHNHIIIKRLKKKIIRYLPAAEIGKPYRNKDWICY